MIDGIIKGNGTSRLARSVLNIKELYPTYDSFIAALAAGTLPLDILFNADGWSQIPDFLNKANLLADEVAAFYGKDNTAVVNDIFKILYDEAVPKVGTIIQSVRKDLPAKWRLCNGGSIDKNTQPEIFEQMKSQFLAGRDETSNSKYAGMQCRNGIVTIDNNEYCAYEDIDDDYLYVAKRTKGSSSWTKYKFTDTYNRYASASGIVYGNGYLAFLYKYDSSIYIYYTQNLNFTSTSDFTKKTIKSGFGETAHIGLSFGNGYWMATARRNDSYFSYITVFYTQNIAGSWTSKNLEDATTSNHYSVSGFFKGNFYLALTGYDSGSGISARIIYGDTPDKITLESGNYMSLTGAPTQCIPIDDVLVLTFNSKIEWFQFLGGTKYTVSVSTRAPAVAKYDDFIILYGYLNKTTTRIYTKKFNADKTGMDSVGNLDISESSKTNPFVYADETGVWRGQTYDTSANKSAIKLPVITADGYYNYILTESL